jgi:hypothetical protein
MRGEPVTGVDAAPLLIVLGSIHCVTSERWRRNVMSLAIVRFNDSNEDRSDCAPIVGSAYRQEVTATGRT